MLVYIIIFILIMLVVAFFNLRKNKKVSYLKNRGKVSCVYCKYKERLVDTHHMSRCFCPKIVKVKYYFNCVRGYEKHKNVVFCENYNSKGKCTFFKKKNFFGF